MNNQKATIIKNASKSVWSVTPAGTTFGKGFAKGTKEFFEAVLEKRFSYECDWLDEIVDFKRFKGKKVLEIGCGAGYDAYQFCRHGADYTGIDIAPDNPRIAQKHLTFYGYQAQFLEMDVEQLSLNEKFDYVFSFGVLHHVPNIQKALKNIKDVLKPGGEAQIIVYHKHSVFYWLSVFFVDWILKRKFLKMSLPERLSQIEYTMAKERPLVKVYSKRSFCKLFRNAGFQIQKVDVRKLVIEDFPDIKFLRRIYKHIPQRSLKFLGKRFGWYLSVRAIKL